MALSNRKLTWRDFERFHACHPHIWSEFCRRVLELYHAGHRRFSQRLISQSIRWHHGDPHQRQIRLKNAWVAFYARKFSKDFPHLGAIFVLRPSDADVPDDRQMGLFD